MLLLMLQLFHHTIGGAQLLRLLWIQVSLIVVVLESCCSWVIKFSSAFRILTAGLLHRIFASKNRVIDTEVELILMAFYLLVAMLLLLGWYFSGHPSLLQDHPSLLLRGFRHWMHIACRFYVLIWGKIAARRFRSFIFVVQVHQLILSFYLRNVLWWF